MMRPTSPLVLQFVTRARVSESKKVGLRQSMCLSSLNVIFVSEYTIKRFGDFFLSVFFCFVLIFLLFSQIKRRIVLFVYQSKYSEKFIVIQCRNTPAVKAVNAWLLAWIWYWFDFLWVTFIHSRASVKLKEFRHRSDKLWLCCHFIVCLD